MIEKKTPTSKSISNTSTKTRRRTGVALPPHALDKTAINKTTDLTPGGSNVKKRTALGASSASVIRTAPKIYAPQYLDSNLNFPRDQRTQNAWNRNFFVTNPLVRSAINLHASYTISKFELECPDIKILEFFNDMLEKMDFYTLLHEISLEFWKLGECTLPGTLITMGDGTVKPIEQLKRGDQVLTHKGNIKSVTDLKTSFVKKDIHHFKLINNNRKLSLTGNHPIWAQKKSEIMCTMPSWENKQRCWPDDCVCKAQYKNRKKQTTKSSAEWKYDFIAAEELNKGDFGFTPYNHTVLAAVPTFINKDWCRSFGLWLAEGCYLKDTRGIMGIVFTNSEQELVDQYTQCMTNLGYSCKTHTQIIPNNTKMYHVKVYDVTLAQQFFSHGGEYSHSKLLSSTVMMLPLELQKEIVAGFIDGDGSVDISNGQIQLATNSLNLRNQFSQILGRLGCIAVYTEHLSKFAGLDKEYTPTYINYRLTIPAHQAWSFKDFILPRKAAGLRNNAKVQTYSRMFDGGSIKQIQSITKEYYEGWVYNLEVEDDHSYVAEGVAVHNCFPYLELDTDQGIWSYGIVHNPDFIRVRTTVVNKDPIITLVPDEALKKLLTSTSPEDRALREQIPSEVVMHIQKGEDIPLENFNISHIKLLSSPYDPRGTSMITSCYRDLMLFDKIREAKIIQADNFINPLTLIKLGDASGNWKPTDDDIRQWQEQMLDSVSDQGYQIITHGMVDIQKITNSGQVLDMQPDLEECKKNIMIGLMVPSSLFDQDYGSYANSSVGLEVLKARYDNFRLQLKRWIEKKVLEPIAKIQDFYVTKNGEPTLLYPRVKWGKLQLKETDSYINSLSQHLAQPGTPGSGMISNQTFFEVIDTDYNAEQRRLFMEARDQIILKKQIDAMGRMDVNELKTLTPDTPILDVRELDAIEQTSDIAGGDSGGGGSGGGSPLGGGGGGGNTPPGGSGGLGSGPELGAPEGGAEPVGAPSVGAPPGGAEPGGAPSGGAPPGGSGGTSGTV